MVTVEQIVRRLIRESPGAAAGGTAPPNLQGSVVLDVTVGSYRCVLLRTPHPAPADGPPGQALSPREVEVARMVARGLPNKAIAHVLDISPWTVGAHVRRIFVKLQVRSRAAMVAALMGQSRSGREGGA